MELFLMAVIPTSHFPFSMYKADSNISDILSAWTFHWTPTKYYAYDIHKE